MAIDLNETLKFAVSLLLPEDQLVVQNRQGTVQQRIALALDRIQHTESIYGLVVICGKSGKSVLDCFCNNHEEHFGEGSVSYDKETGCLNGDPARIELVHELAGDLIHRPGTTATAKSHNSFDYFDPNKQGMHNFFRTQISWLLAHKARMGTYLPNGVAFVKMPSEQAGGAGDSDAGIQPNFYSMAKSFQAAMNPQGLRECILRPEYQFFAQELRLTQGIDIEHSIVGRNRQLKALASEWYLRLSKIRAGRLENSQKGEFHQILGKSVRGWDPAEATLWQRVHAVIRCYYDLPVPERGWGAPPKQLTLTFSGSKPRKGYALKTMKSSKRNRVLVNHPVQKAAFR